MPMTLELATSLSTEELRQAIKRVTRPRVEQLASGYATELEGRVGAGELRVAPVRPRLRGRPLPVDGSRQHFTWLVARIEPRGAGSVLRGEVDAGAGLRSTLRGAPWRAAGGGLLLGLMIGVKEWSVGAGLAGFLGFGTLYLGLSWLGWILLTRWDRRVLLRILRGAVRARERRAG
jgi:hypothetical protein